MNCKVDINQLRVRKAGLPPLLLWFRRESFRAFLSLLCFFVAIASSAQNQNPLTERAYQDREILYELQSPESHAFRITHDYTVRKIGEKYYFNVVRAGSHVSDPESIDLDTGAKLKCEIISGKQAVERKLPVGETLKDDSEIVVTYLSLAIAPGTTNRIRL